MTNRTIPKLRFKGFKNRWYKNYIGRVLKVSSSKRVHQSEWTKKGIPFLRARDIVAKIQGLKVNNPLFISKKTYLNHSKTSGVPSIGDLLVTGVGTIGEPLLVKTSKPFYFKDGNIIWFHNDKLDKYFFYYYFLTNTFKKYIKATTNVGTVSTYTITSGRHTPITYPTLSEQQQIGKFFATLDRLAQLQKKKVALLKKLKKAYLQKLFLHKDEDVPRLRFKGFHDKWTQSTLDKLANISTGSENANAMVKNGKYNFYTSGIKVYKINDYKFNDNAITIAGNGENVGYMHLANGKFNAYQRTYVLHHIKVNREYLFYFIHTLMPKLIYEHSHIGSIPYIVIGMLNNLTIRTPTITEQNKIGNFFKCINSLIQLQKKKFFYLRKLKKAYLQKMFC